MTRMRQLTRVFGSINYPVPREGEHGILSCWFGRHWWALVRSSHDGTPVGIVCPTCCRVLEMHDGGEQRHGVRP